MINTNRMYYDIERYYFKSEHEIKKYNPNITKLIEKLRKIKFCWYFTKHTYGYI